MNDANSSSWDVLMLLFAHTAFTEMGGNWKNKNVISSALFTSDLIPFVQGSKWNEEKDTLSNWNTLPARKLHFTFTKECEIPF